MHVDSSVALFQHALRTRLLQLTLQNSVRAICLLLVSLVCIIILRSIVVPEPVALTGHRTQRAHEEEDPLVEIDSVLFAVAGPELVGLVVHAADVVDACSGFPGYDAGVGVF